MAENACNLLIYNKNYHHHLSVINNLATMQQQYKVKSNGNTTDLRQAGRQSLHIRLTDACTRPDSMRADHADMYELCLPNVC